MKRIILTEEIYDKISEDYYKNKLPDELSFGMKKYRGKNVIWYGTPERMVVVHKSKLKPRYGNVFYPDKMKEVENKVKNSPEPVEFKSGYGSLMMVGFTAIQEELKAYYDNTLQSEYGKSEPYSTGDDELDKYIGDEYFLEEELDIDNHALLKFYTDNKYFMYNGFKSIDKIQQEFESLKANEELSEEEEDSIDEFLRLEEEIKDTIENKGGDIGDYIITVRDGNHRTFGSINGGEDYIAIDLLRDSINEMPPEIINKIKV